MLDRDLARALALEDRRRPVAVVREVRVREVVHEHDLALAREVDEALQLVEARARRRRVVRERAEQDARPRLRREPRLLDAGREVDARPDRHARDRRAGEARREEMDRIARARHERDVARAEQHPEQVHETLLRAERHRRLRLRIELDARTGRDRGRRSPRAASAARGSTSSGGCAAAARPRAASRRRPRAAARRDCRSRGRSRPRPRAAARASAARPRRTHTAGGRRPCESRVTRRIVAKRRALRGRQPPRRSRRAPASGRPRPRRRSRRAARRSPARPRSCRARRPRPASTRACPRAISRSASRPTTAPPMKATSVPGTPRERRGVECLDVVRGERRHRLRDAAVRDRDARRLGNGGDRRDAGHELERDAGADERERLLPAAAEDERVAALQAHDAAPSPCRARRAGR